MNKTWRTTPLFLLLGNACSGDGNTGKQLPSADLVAAVPWTNGVVPLQDEQGKAVLPAQPVFPAIGPGTPDPGSRPVDCSGLANIELAAWVEDFEPTVAELFTSSPTWGVAEAWSSYDDGSAGAFRSPGDASWYDGLALPRQYGEEWGLSATPIGNGPSCDGAANGWAFRFVGGRFNWYGAGASHPLAIGTAARNHCTQDPPADFCPLDAGGAPQYWDLSSYDGIVFWARRGPDSQPGVLLGIQTKHTSDDLAKGNQTYCRRIKSCKVECDNGAPCTLVKDAGLADPDTWRCLPAGADPSRLREPSLIEELYPRCGESTCVSPSYITGRDPEFDTAQCKPYVFSGMESDNYCYAEEPPPLAHERCGDAFVAPVHMSTDWKLFKIPFSEFRQVGFGKPAPEFDLTTVYSIAFQFTVGFADMYVDNVSFYRNKD